MHRRKLLKLLAATSMPPVLPARLLAAFREVHATLSPIAVLKILSPPQDATVTAMAELLIPRTDTPGAKDVRVNEFIDRILADWYSDADRECFLAGLADVDRRTQNLFNKNFVDASVDQQSEILRALGENLAKTNAALASAPRGYRGSAPEPENNFYLMFRQLALTGYFTSEAGFTRQLREEIVPGRYDACAPLPPLVPTKGA